MNAAEGIMKRTEHLIYIKPQPNTAKRVAFAQLVPIIWSFTNWNFINEGNKIVDHSDVVGATPVGAAPTTSSFST